MTIEVFQPVDPYVIAGTGPYSIGHPYGDNDEFVVSVFDGTNYIQLDAALWSISPESSDEEGDLTLDAATATTYAGNTIYIVRRTVPEQGWEGINGEREKGLEVQLDYLTMTVQDMQGQLDKGLFELGASSGVPVVMVAGRVPIVSDDGNQLLAGPTADQVEAAQGYSEAAETAKGIAEAKAVVAQNYASASESTAINSANSATAAAASATTATEQAVVAQNYASAAEGSAIAAGQSATSAATSASAASTDATSAAASASTATTKADEAAASATSGAGSASTATTKATEATQARDKAEKWADEAEDTEVETGKFSAKHWAAKAAAAASTEVSDDTTPQLGGNLDLNGNEVGTGAVRLTATGITFDSGTNELDDYEEGDFTPAVGAVTGSITTSSASGYYTKKGREVTLHILVTVTDNGTGAVALSITNLPFTPSTDISTFSGTGYHGSNGYALSGAISSSTLYIRYYDGSYPVTNGQTIYFTITYYV